MFQKIAQWFSNLLKNPLVQKFEQFLKEVFTAEKPLIIAALKDIATTAVKQVDGLETLTNEEKRAQAFAQISNYARTKGIAVGASMINLAIEMAVQAVKGNK